MVISYKGPYVLSSNHHKVFWSKGLQLKMSQCLFNVSELEVVMARHGHAEAVLAGGLQGNLLCVMLEDGLGDANLLDLGREGLVADGGGNVVGVPSVVGKRGVVCQRGVVCNGGVVGLGRDSPNS
jgi:hypothetical protein